MAQIVTNLDCYLDQAVEVNLIWDKIFDSANKNNKISVAVYKNRLKQAANLSGTIKVYVVRPDGVTVSANGSYSGNVASAVLPESAYAVTGPITVTILNTEGSTKTTLAALVGSVF